MDSNTLVGLLAVTATVMVPVAGMVLFFERRLSRVETKMDAAHDDFAEFKKIVLGRI